MTKDFCIEAKKDNTQKAVSFVKKELDRLGVPTRVKVSLITAVEEIFLNIVKYAYGDGPGDATILMDLDEEGCSVTLTFIDNGPSFDPVSMAEPDIYLPLEERPIGGLGILMVKRTMDDVFYSREDGENRLSITKSWDA